MNIKEIDPWYALFWVGILTMLAWAILKAVGVIQTPVWVEMIPMISGIAATIGITKYVVKYVVLIKVLDHRMGEVEKGLDHVEIRLGNVELKLENHDRKLFQIENKL